jgi:hypothetical protein
MNAIAAPADASRPRDIVEVIRVLVLLQGAALVVSTLEALVFLGFAGPTGVPTVVLTGLAALVTFAVAAGLGRRSARARRITLFAEGAIAAIALIDLALSLLMTGEPLPLVSTIARLVLPLAVIAVLRDAAVRASFRAVPATPAVAP